MSEKDLQKGLTLYRQAINYEKKNPSFAEKVVNLFGKLSLWRLSGYKGKKLIKAKFALCF